MTVVDLPDRPIYLYSEVDRLAGLGPGTARRWLNGYRRDGRTYAPILRENPLETEWATWGEFVEVNILAKYRDAKIPTPRLRQAVEALRQQFDLKYPLAYADPYLHAESGDLVMPADIEDDEQGRLIVRTGQLLLGPAGQSVIHHATLARDASGKAFAAQLVPDENYPSIVVNPDRRSGEPTFRGRRLSVGMIAGLVGAGEDRAAIAADYDLSLADINDAVEFTQRYRVAA